MSENGTEQGLVLDFSRVTKDWRKKLRATLRKVTEAQIVAELPPPATSDHETVEAHLERLRKAWDTIDEQAKLQNALICEIVVSVPQDWLTSDAPDDVDWDDPESLEYIRPDCYWRLAQQAQTGQLQQGDSKN